MLNLLLSLDLPSFKVEPCNIKTQHPHKQCQYYHYPKDRKRAGFFYSTDLCEAVDLGSICPYGDTCLKSHSRVEQLYNPSKYKTKFCGFYPDRMSQCEYGDFCSFAHSESEISIELIHKYTMDADFFIFHYKTVMCPFNQKKHDKSTCVYAHNWQDFRRKPSVTDYENIQCVFWKSSDFVVNYEDCCPEGFNCKKCHGWKEYDFHPMVWMTKPCPKAKLCSKGKDCAFYHDIREKR